MRRHTMDEVTAAMDRLSDAIDAFKTREEHDDYFRRSCSYTGFKETAAIRRASMDLTRALTELRKP
jgi:hypothetical protein